MTDNIESIPESLSVNEFLIYNAHSALDLQRHDGSFPPSKNGVYEEPETPVRTTSYWLPVLAQVYDQTNQDIFEQAANAAANYLLTEEVRPYGYTFQSRKTDELDYCDGLVGQSGPIRGLTRAGKLLERPELVEVAKEVYDFHKYSQHVSLWRRREIDGENLSFDRTLNHQIVFAAAASELSTEYHDVRTDIERFLDNLAKNMSVNAKGRIRHYVSPSLPEIINVLRYEEDGYNLIWNALVSLIYLLHNPLKEKEIGYHITNLVRLAVLNKKFPQHEFWFSTTFENMLEFITTNEYKGLIHTTKTNMGSSLPLIDQAIVCEIFNYKTDISPKALVEMSINQNWDEKSGLLTKNAVDQNMQAASVTRFLELPNYNLELS